MHAIIVDTDVASFLFKKDTRAKAYQQYVNPDAVPGISFMTLAELEQWAILRNWGPDKRAEMLRFVSDTSVVIESNDALCRMWAEIRGMARRVGRPIDVPDAWIAATALLHGAGLVTHNASHFDFLPGLQIISEA